MATKPYRTAPDPHQTGWPPGIPYIIGNEGCERFSFYGMRAILFVYIYGLLMNFDGLAEDEAKRHATQINHLFVAAAYAFPVLGALIADRFWGKYRTIMILSLFYCLGHAALAIFENPAWQLAWLDHVWVSPKLGLFIGLALIGIGSGGIKPCVSAHVGDQFGPSNWHLLEKVFNAFYFIINFGSAFATIFIPAIRGERLIDESGMVVYRGSVSLAFAIPGILMGLATIFFWMGRHKFIHVPPSHPGRVGLLDVLSGSSLFAVIAFPIFGHEFMSWMTVGICSASSLLVFIVLFSVRQRIEQDDGFLAILFYCARAWIFGERGAGSSQLQSVATHTRTQGHEEHPLQRHWFFAPAVRRFGLELAEGPVAVLKIMSVFIFISVFWALFDQHSSTWIAQAELMDLSMRFPQSVFIIGGMMLGIVTAGAFFLTLRRQLTVWLIGGTVIGGVLGGIMFWYGKERIDPSQVPAANPFLVMLLIPYNTFGFYPLMRRLSVAMTPLQRMTLGMLIASLAFVSAAVIQMLLDGGLKLHVGWQMISYLLLTESEVLISITGLEFAYSQAPKRMKSVMMSFWLLNVTLGNVLVVFLAGFENLEAANFFWVFAGLMLLAGLLFGLRAMFYRYQDYTQ
jgi:POT family proton-dependent oligopeptide transporter